MIGTHGGIRTRHCMRPKRIASTFGLHEHLYVKNIKSSRKTNIRVSSIIFCLPDLMLVVEKYGGVYLQLSEYAL